MNEARMAADDLPTSLVGRRDQMFPRLTDAEITRITRFGTTRRYEAGDRLFAAGEKGPGMHVVLKGNVVISQRDGLGHVVPIISQGRGHLLAQGLQLSRRTAVVHRFAGSQVQ